MPEIDDEVEAILRKAMALMARVNEITADAPEEPESIQMRRSAASMVTNLGQALAIARREAEEGGESDTE